MRRNQLVEFVALALVALGVPGQIASCGDLSSFQDVIGQRAAEPDAYWQPPETPGYFDTGSSQSESFPNGTSPPEAFWESPVDAQPAGDKILSPETLRSLMRPKIAFRSEWLTASDFDLSTYDIGLTVPGYPFFGPPPPMIRGGFVYTDLADGAAIGLPDNLFEYSIGLSWIRPINERWMVRSMLGAALATDNMNMSSDAWQFRGGVFAVYEPDERWQWIVGAIAIGRNDLPVLPAVGVIWSPGPELKIDLTFPKPKLAMLIADDGSRQQWGYIGTGLGGGTWAYERADGTDDELTYGDWRLIAGWESLPAPLAGAPFTPGRRLGVEVGYVFSRDLEFSSGSPDISLSDALLLDITMRF